MYKRLRFLNNKTYSQLGVLLFLAIWHGYHSGYYLTFFYEFMIMLVENNVSTLTLDVSCRVQILRQDWVISFC